MRGAPMTSYEAINLWLMMTTLSSSSVVKEQELPKSFIDISAHCRGWVRMFTLRFPSPIFT